MKPSPRRDTLAALLMDEGFLGFEESDEGLTGFFDKQKAGEGWKKILRDAGVTYEILPDIQEENWNSLWESSIKPVDWENVYIRAHFHDPAPEGKIEVIIDPKMSFGTGYHETTKAMISLMQSVDFSGKTVIDMGTGTGILAILAEKYGAKEIFAVDNDIWAYENALENVAANRCGKIRIFHGDAALLDGFPAADVFLANINKNILLRDIPAYCKASRGPVLLSGFYETDLPDIAEAMRKCNKKLEKKIVLNDWVGAKFG